jgi:hypothetical protein
MVASKNGVNVLEKWPGCQPKISVVCRRNVEDSTRKMSLVSSGNIQDGSQEIHQCAGEVSGVASKKCVGVLLKCPEWQQSLRQCAGDVSRVAPKNGVSVQARTQGCHRKKGFYVLVKCTRWQQKICISVHANCRGWQPRKC